MDTCPFCFDVIPPDDLSAWIDPETGRVWHSFCKEGGWKRDAWIQLGRGYLHIQERHDGALYVGTRQDSSTWGTTEAVWLKGEKAEQLRQFFREDAHDYE